MKVTRKILLRFALLGTSVLLGLLAVEIGLRWLDLDVQPLWRADPRLGWRPVPLAHRHFTEEGDGWVDMNALGFRDRPREWNKRPGTFRIAVFGDSMTEGDQVHLQQTYCSLLEDRLKRQGGEIEVLNLGVTGYTTIQELLLLRDVGPKFSPDLIILATFLDNDVACSFRRTNTGPGEAPFAVLQSAALKLDFSGAEEGYADYLREPRYTLRKCSAMYRWMGRWRKQSAGVAMQRGTLSNPVPRRHQLYQPDPPKEWESAWAVYEQALLDFAAEVQRQQASFIILEVPAGQVVRRDAWLATCGDWPAELGAEKWDLEGPQRRLKHIADEHQLVLCSPGDAFKAAPADPPLFFGTVGHMTPAGHEQMARDLTDFLLERRLVPAAEKKGPLLPPNGGESGSASPGILRPHQTVGPAIPSALSVHSQANSG